ncbi:arsenite efflux transporter metallochaperone ArsD [Apibacter muscae]|uniref:Arsenite efflux transporter metallochaperone ArsD n=1 Tax=Apibacter muscae TaxID=2509004 RepID=A0A563D898_9FLAO|nr:arsenite efflux transporter metallochaperone ArsD [Apibacter muscae]TWP26233.1 arsenite efflux transporter metallochaperone ArsD [Apibacter muscae]
MKTIEIFDPSLCCSTGVCGPSVDTDLMRIASSLDKLKKQGAIILRHNLNTEPQAYIDHPLVNEQLTKFGVDILPITVVDGEIVLTKKYPTDAQLENWTGLTI